MRFLAELKKIVEQWRELEKKVDDITELAGLVSDEEETSLDKEIELEIKEIESRIDELEFVLSFSGEYDNRKAILSIYAGAGGSNHRIGRRC